jgi:hypothetical protein
LLDADGALAVSRSQEVRDLVFWPACSTLMVLWPYPALRKCVISSSLIDVDAQTKSLAAKKDARNFHAGGASVTAHSCIA